MKTKSWEVELPAPWESLKIILSEPEKTMPFFPYFEGIEGTRVKFKVPRFIFNFGYEFDLSVGFQKNKAVYVLTGNRGTLTITFEMHGHALRVTASWAGFGETFMGKPLENFAKGIAEAIKEFCSAQAACPVVRETLTGKIAENITPEFAPALIKRVFWELEGADFSMKGVAEDGTTLKIEVRDGKLTNLTVQKGENETTIEADIPVLELDKELFEGLPLDKKFTIEIKKL
ncbi:hypothetical protein [Thermococcus sp.]